MYDLLDEEETLRSLLLGKLSDLLGGTISSGIVVSPLTPSTGEVFSVLSGFGTASLLLFIWVGLDEDECSNTNTE